MNDNTELIDEHQPELDLWLAQGFADLRSAAEAVVPPGPASARSADSRRVPAKRWMTAATLLAAASIAGAIILNSPAPKSSAITAGGGNEVTPTLLPAIWYDGLDGTTTMTPADGSQPRLPAEVWYDGETPTVFTMANPAAADEMPESPQAPSAQAFNTDTASGVVETLNGVLTLRAVGTDASGTRTRFMAASSQLDAEQLKQFAAEWTANGTVDGLKARPSTEALRFFFVADNTHPYFSRVSTTAGRDLNFGFAQIDGIDAAAAMQQVKGFFSLSPILTTPRDTLVLSVGDPSIAGFMQWDDDTLVMVGGTDSRLEGEARDRELTRAANDLSKMLDSVHPATAAEMKALRTA